MKYWNINLKDMIEARVHLGYVIKKKKWNLKNEPFFYKIHHDLYIINILKTARFLSEACHLVFDAAKKKKQFLIVCTKKKYISELITCASLIARCHYINKKWIGGMLTNWSQTEKKLRTLNYYKLNYLKKKKKLRNLNIYLEGIKYMKKLPDIVIIINPQDEYMTLKECITLKIPTICLIDIKDYPYINGDILIPININSLSSIKFIINKIFLAICEGNYQ
uniref:Small ribosomal subunit protein uS2c n=1 Tax=Mitrastemon kanehirai TaxID=1358725 RepID=A0A4Y1MCU6_9ERIC|nr:ribosomal protein S2 [Mitrastemon kanehirai]